MIDTEKPLKTTFRKWGYVWQQEMRNCDVVLYKQGLSHWVVALVQHNKKRVIQGKSIGASESLPGGALWGQKAWTYMDREKALEKFNALIA
jgi:4-hydroxyphenylpyruvate dioxygenase-like putative hemolysin